MVIRNHAVRAAGSVKNSADREFQRRTLDKSVLGYCLAEIFNRLDNEGEIFIAEVVTVGD